MVVLTKGHEIQLHMCRCTKETQRCVSLTILTQCECVVKMKRVSKREREREQ